jgi:hypothetical protein
MIKRCRIPHAHHGCASNGFQRRDGEYARSPCVKPGHVFSSRTLFVNTLRARSVDDLSCCCGSSCGYCGCWPLLAGAGLCAVLPSLSRLVSLLTRFLVNFLGKRLLPAPPLFIVEPVLWLRLLLLFVGLRFSSGRPRVSLDALLSEEKLVVVGGRL